MTVKPRPGYKQTEVGVIPEEWEVNPLKDLSEKIMVGIASAATHAYRSKGIVLLRNQNIKSNYLDDQDILYINPDYEAIFKNKRLQNGDLLTARTGYPGITCIVPQKYELAQSFTTLITRPNRRVIDSTYLCYYINSERGQGFFEQNQIGGGQKNINAGSLQQMPVPVPLLHEQHAIAAALSDVDALLAKLDQLIAKKRDIKQAAMQELLTGKRRLPGFDDEWKIQSLFELADNKKEFFDDGDWIEAEFLTESGVRLVQTGNIGEGRFIDKESKKYISDNSFKKLGCKKLSIGDILICRLAEPAGRACILPDIGEARIITAVDVTIFRPTDSMANPRYLVQVFSTRKWFEGVNERCGGSTRTRIARKELGKMEIKIPPLPEQVAIAAVLSDMDAEIAALEARRDKTRAVKHGMMRELLTGRIRLV